MSSVYSIKCYSHHLFIDFKNVNDLYSIYFMYNFIEFGVLKKLVGLMKICPKETCIKALYITFFDQFYIQNVPKQEHHHYFPA
jgi:hypothetical protein